MGLDRSGRAAPAGAQDFIIQDAAGNGRKNCGRSGAKELSKKRSIDDFHRWASLSSSSTFLLGRRCPPSREETSLPTWINDTVVERNHCDCGSRRGKRARRRRARHPGKKEKKERKMEEEEVGGGESPRSANKLIKGGGRRR